MNKLKYILLCGVTTACFTACSDNNDAVQATGEVNVRIVADNSLATSRAEVTPTHSIDLDVLDLTGGIVKSYKDAAATTVERFTLPVGTYVFHAYSANLNNSEPYFEDVTAYYETRDTVHITKGSMQDIKLVCRLAMAKVSVNYSDELKQFFTQLDCNVCHSSGTLLYNKEETRAGYFPATGDLTLALDVTNTLGNSYHSEQTIRNVKSRTHYRINYSLDNDGAGNFDIVLDPSTNEITYNVGVPLKSAYSVLLTTPDAYGKMAYLYAHSTRDDNTGLVFQYIHDEATDNNWVSVKAEEQMIDGVKTLVAKTNELDFDTKYKVRVALGNEAVSDTDTLRTEAYQEIPNLGFESWRKKKNIVGRNVWYPNSDSSNSYWATGNEGVGLAKDCNTTRINDDEAYDGYTARLETVTVTSAKYAAGNLFIGTYETNWDVPASSVQFGRPYTGARPVKLKGWYKYSPAAISNTDGQYPADDSYLMDTGDIYIKLWDGTDTATANVIAEAHFIPEGTVDEYTQFEIPVSYTSKAHPQMLTIVCTSSRYGGYFDDKVVVGKVGVGSILWVDDFELEYYK